ncbi:MAG: ankyrin repeat protein [Cocleimonas sp.]|jgi:ankyrin repeat protein
MSKLIKNIFLRVAVHYTKNRFTGVEVDKNPFGKNIENNSTIMKFPSLSFTLKLLKPFAKKESKTESVHETAMTSYDKIEEIISIADVDTNSLEIVVKFYNLTEIQQQLMIVTLIEHEMIKTLEVILLSPYDINFLIRGQTPLHFAIKIQNQKMISLLIKHKADLDLKDNFKETALNCAVRTSNTSVMKYLLVQGADVNTQASDSSTPLEYAIYQGDIESVNILEKYGAILGSSYLVKNI